jgi:pterin-4a-carbinolamine dehydratase
MTPLTAQEVAARMAALPEWRIEAGVLTRTFSFKDFLEPVYNLLSSSLRKAK